MDLNVIRDRAYAGAKERGFWDYADIKEEKVRIGCRLALVHCEVSEAIEELRKPDMDIYKFGEELIDVIIRIGDIAAYYNIDLDSTMESKLNHNLTRPLRHNKDL